MKRDGKRITGQCDYILAATPTAFRSFKMKDPRYFKSDHRMLVGRLQIESQKRHLQYTKKRTRFVLPVKAEDKKHADRLMEELVEIIKKPKANNE
jgi:hypothetical protein